MNDSRKIEMLEEIIGTIQDHINDTRLEEKISRIRKSYEPKKK